jgi:DNA-binding ferritin-like protein (Dps family)
VLIIINNQLQKEKKIEMDKTLEFLFRYIKWVKGSALKDIFLFRGQSEDYPLLPKIARIDLLRTYRNSVLKTEKKMFEDFKRCSRPAVEKVPDDEDNLEWLSLAQHHGLATRMLDWTKNPLAALWFAVRKPIKNIQKRIDKSDFYHKIDKLTKGSKNRILEIDKLLSKVYDTTYEQGIKAYTWKEGAKEKDFQKILKTLADINYIRNGVVWKLEVKDSDLLGHDANPFKIKETKVYEPKYISKRIVSQQGCFTIHAPRKEKFIVFEEDNKFKHRLNRMVIPAEFFSELRVYLHRFAVNSSTLFPDLDNISAHIIWDNSVFSDECYHEWAY